MNEFDVLITNIFISLAKGDITSDFYSRYKYKQFGVEQTLRPPGRSPFPTDILCFSRYLNHFFLLEAKDTTTSELNVSQIDSYNSLDNNSFRDLGYRYEPAQLRWEVAFIGHTGNIDHLKRGLAAHSPSMPLLCYDNSRFTIKLVDSSTFTKRELNDLFRRGVDLNISDESEISQYVNFSPQSNHYKVLLPVTSVLVASLTSSDRVYYDILASKSFSSITGLWEATATSFKEQLISKVKSSLIALRQEGLTELQISESYCSLDIRDTNRVISPAKLQSIKLKIEAAQAVLSAQMPLL